jgi:hypothetical protein
MAAIYSAINLIFSNLSYFYLRLFMLFAEIEPTPFKRLQRNCFKKNVMNHMLIASDLNESSKDTVYRVIP